MADKSLLTCYRHGCGEQYNPEDNKDGDCVYHPGVPVFHDAYKGWSCCKKKTTDFTEFLNIQGCTKSSHSNEKPEEPEKLREEETEIKQTIEVKPLVPSSLPRPDFHSSQVTLVPVISPTLLQQIKGLGPRSQSSVTEITEGQTCYNKGCSATYSSRDENSDDEACTYHPGVPIFHEGLKYWSCCPKKKSSDFTAFMGYPGCAKGKHKWVDDDKNRKDINCRMDWHQTGSFVVISIFGKKYEPSKSTVKLSPIRLSVDIFFIEEDSRYKLDIELKGIVDVAASSVSMLPTKVEIKLRKAEAGSWSQLFIPRTSGNDIETRDSNDKEDINDRVEAVDLNDL